MTDREAFEAWLDSEHLFDTAEFIYNEAIKQKAKDENLVWKAWQAATKAERERCAEIAFNALDDQYLSGHGYADRVSEAIRGEG